jgi:hypothetical protein
MPIGYLGGEVDEAFPTHSHAASSEDPGALVLQLVLQQFGVRTHLYRFYQKRNVEDFFAGKGVPEECRYTVLCAHGHGPDDDPVGFEPKVVLLKRSTFRTKIKGPDLLRSDPS